LVKSLLSFEVDVSNSMLLPRIDAQIHKLIPLIQEIDQSIRNQDSRVMLIKLKEASGVAQVIFGMITDAAQSAKREKRWIAIWVVETTAAIGGGGTAVTALATAGTVALAPVVATAAIGALIGTAIVIVPYNLYANRIDFEARMRYRELLAEMVRVKSLAEQLYVISRDDSIFQFIDDLEGFEDVIMANL